jgi:hypothetical protein
MTLTDNFDGTLPSPILLTVVTPNAGSTVPIQGVEKITAPMRECKEDKYTVISGTKANKELVLLCSQMAGELTGTLVYEKAHDLAMDALVGVNYCTISLVFPDGLTYAGTGGVKKSGPTQLEDSKHISSDIAISWDAGWIKADAAVPPYTVTVGGGGTTTIDLTACGVGGTTDLSGKRLYVITVTAGSGNAASITIAKAGTTGYDIGGSYSRVLTAGEGDVTLGTVASPLVSGTAKDLTVSGTAADTLTISIVAM